MIHSPNIIPYLSGFWGSSDIKIKMPETVLNKTIKAIREVEKTPQTIAMNDYLLIVKNSTKVPSRAWGIEDEWESDMSLPILSQIY